MPPSPASPSANSGGENAKVQFHSVSLHLPVAKPIVLNVDSEGQCNGSIGSSGADAALAFAKQMEGESNGQLIVTATNSKPPTKLTSLLRALLRVLRSRRFLLTLVILLSLLALLLIASLAILISASSQRQQQEEDAAFLNRDISWRASCERKCNANFDVPPLLLISMDGFRADYLQRGITQAVQRIMQCGASAEHMLPSYPSKTFPNHYSIVTGLYPESHGIVDNHFYDNKMPEERLFARSSRNPAWYNGEPIWNTVTKNGKKSAIFFWPGSEVPIQGMLPTYRYKYNATTPFSKRVDQVINWLRLEENDRPAFLAMYFEQPDTAMHREGPDSDAVNSALIYVDSMINYLMQQLDNNGFLGCINMIIVSDHGAQKLREDMYVPLDRYVDVNDPNVRVFPGVIGHINLLNDSSALLNKALIPMACSGGQTFRIYTRESMPRRYHYTQSNRIGEIVVDSAVGTKLFVSQAQLNASTDKGDHGYDNRAREMRAIFGAWGPSIVQRHSERAFQNVELYNLFTSLMRLPVMAPNNGTKGRLNSLLRTPPTVEDTPMVELSECEDARLAKCGDGCHFELHYGQSDSVSVALTSSSASAAQSVSSISTPSSPAAVYSAHHCKHAEAVRVPVSLNRAEPMCMLRLCNATLVLSRRRGMAHFVESQLTMPIPNIDHRANCTAHFVVPPLSAPDSPPTPTSTTTEGEATQATAILTMERRKRTQPMNWTEEGEEEAENNYIGHHGDVIMTEQEQGESPLQVQNEAARGENVTEAAPLDTDAPPLRSEEQLECMRTMANGGGGAAGADAQQPLRVTLFPDNDYARYILEGQIPVSAGFYNGVWQEMLSLVRQYVQHYGRLLMWTGPVFDHNNDGLADPIGGVDSAAVRPLPSHLFLILLRCPSSGDWDPSGRHCTQTANTTTLAFVLPLLERDLNCLFPVEYIFRHTARIRDIELLTGNEWFADRDVYPAVVALQLRTYINDQLWQLELNEGRS